MANFDDFKLAVEALSGGKNTVLFDNAGMPSVMVPIPKMKIKDLITSGGEGVHPAFKVSNIEKDVMYFSKFQNIVVNDRAYSLPMRDPANTLDFDKALKYCRNKGKGWSLTPYSLWCAVALWCKKNGTMPRGNNQFGADVTYAHEKGVGCHIDTSQSNKTGRVLTGSGPATWYHDGTTTGIADMNGNVWEWTAGMRLVDGEIQVIQDSNCMLESESMADGSSGWKAIKKDGSLVDKGTENTLKWDKGGENQTDGLKLTAGNVTAKADDKQYYGAFHSMKLDTGSVDEAAPELAKLLLLYPEETSDKYNGDWHWANMKGERLPICGGDWDGGALAGVFAVNLTNPRSYAGWSVGFRSAFVNL